MSLQVIILQGVVAPEPSLSIDVLKYAAFHFRTMDNPDEDLLKIDMDDLHPYMEPDNNESLINIQQPLKVFYMDNDKQITDIKQQAGIIKKGQ